ncbi:testis-specific serine/threonine-protein kinase 1-like [Plectropomus leopardus]|uniref:testis-specific serine/threonine-protein kinase 1-like n=1 Tax=Plectropomus leopardus TaxID=160734 RepID=UPI001C4D9B94|nr:testis-specific serine/threonine-protein kinase 1-like [Plectropomus leopardus]
MESRGYAFKRNLGEGMSGKVVCAYSARLRRRVAIKVIDKKKANTNYLENFLPREIEIIRSLDHPNIAKTFDVFESLTSKVYIVMELCVKGDVLNYIDTKGAFPENSSCRLFSQLCDAIQYLHDSNVAHRDLKCENLLLDTEFSLKVCDFGFSKRLTYADGRMVLSKTFCGTPSYAAPEIMRSFPYNPKVSDVWSMGVVLYMMLYASMPFDATNVKRMLRIQIQHNIHFSDTPAVSSEAKELIRSILHPNVEKRITISKILQCAWILQEGRMEDSDEEHTSNAGSGQEGPPDEKAKESSDPGEGPSAAAPRH